MSEAAGPVRSQWRDVWDQFRNHRGAVLGAVLVGAVILPVISIEKALRSRGKPTA